MKPLKSKIKVYKIASYDIETYKELKDGRTYNKFLLGGYIGTDGKYKSFTDRKEMIKYIDEHTDSKTITFATNNMFDYQALYSGEKDYYQHSVLPKGSRLIITKYHGNIMYDTINYVAHSVKDLGKMLGLQKGDLDVAQLETPEYYETHPKEFRVLRNYNQMDCKITREFMVQFQTVLNELGGQLKSTIGSCALDLFRRKFQKENWYKEYPMQFPDEELVYDFLFRGYRGGRTETFKRGDTDYIILKAMQDHKEKKEFYYYDFCSMYAYCMRGEFSLPSSARINYSPIGLLNTENIIKYNGMSECTVVIPYMKHPMMPTTINHKLCFPIGRIEREVFTHGELRKLLSMGGVIEKIFKTIYYTKTFSPFTEWVDTLYGKRLIAQKNGNKVYDTVYKNLLVNLYGKLGTHKLKRFELINFDDEENLMGVQYDEETNTAYRETPDDSEKCYVFPIIPAEVTMKGRLMIHDKIVETDAIQCDTDSVFTDVMIATSNELGMMKLEDTINTLTTIKPKWYSYYSKTKGKMVYKLKGIKLSFDDEKRAKEFTDAMDGKNVNQWKFLKMKESLRGGGRPNETIEFTKRMTVKDDKRIWILPFNKYEFQESKPIILGFKNIDALDNYFK